MSRFYENLIGNRSLDRIVDSFEFDEDIEKLFELLGEENESIEYNEVYESLRKLNDKVGKEGRLVEKAFSFISEDILKKLRNFYYAQYKEIEPKEIKSIPKGTKAKVIGFGSELNKYYRIERNQNFPIGSVGEVIYYRNEDALLLFPEGDYSWSRDWENTSLPDEFLKPKYGKRIGRFKDVEIKILVKREIILKRKLESELERFEDILRGYGK